MLVVRLDSATVADWSNPSVSFSLIISTPRSIFVHMAVQRELRRGQGTPGFIPPEAAFTAVESTVKQDLFSLGHVILLVLAKAGIPHDGNIFLSRVSAAFLVRLTFWATPRLWVNAQETSPPLFLGILDTWNILRLVFAATRRKLGH